jgi:diguanylate cyclase (GGDEF)-like protein/PAS domain S-box-containing protein
MMLANRRLNFILPLVIGLFALAIEFVAFFGVRGFVLSATERDMVRLVRAELVTVQGAIEQLLRLGGRDAVLNTVSSFGAYPATQVMLVVDAEGQVIASTNYLDVTKTWQGTGYAISADLVDQIATKRGTKVTIGEDEDYIYAYSSICHGLKGDGLRPQRCGFAFYQVDLGPARALAMESLRAQTLITGVGILVMALVVWWLLHSLLARRAGDLVMTVNAYGRGDRGIRSRLESEDELGQIAQAVNRMLEQLDEDERALQAKESRLSATFDAVVDGIVVIDDHGIMLSCNAGLERIFGYGPEEIVGQNIKMLMPEPFHSAHDGYVAQWRGRGRLSSSVLGKGRELLGLRKDGGVFPVEVTVSAIDDAGERKVVGVIRDITQRKAAEEGLQLAQKVFENTNEAIVITDKDNRIVNVNQAYVDTTGYNREEVLGGNPNITSSGRHDADFYRAMWKDIEEQGSWSGEIWDRKKTGEVFPKWLNINAIKNRLGKVTHYVGIFTDISHQKRVEQQLEQLAYYDPLTQLPNRLLFFDRLVQGVLLAKRETQTLGLLFVDLDGFKNVNDTLGHNIGDLLLIEVAGRIRNCLRKSDTVARLGGDEFTVILNDVHGESEVVHIAQNIIDRLQTQFEIKDNGIRIGASIGISLFPRDGDDQDTLVKCADTAMYAAKAAGKGVYRFFSEELERNGGK